MLVVTKMLDRRYRAERLDQMQATAGFRSSVERFCIQVAVAAGHQMLASAVLVVQVDLDQAAAEEGVERQAGLVGLAAMG